MLYIGDIIDNRYEIIEYIAEGGMSKVYKGKHLVLKNIWSIKEIYIGSNLIKDLLAEANISRKLKHSRLPRIIDIFKIENYLYLIMDFIEGIPADMLLKEKGFLKSKW